jgi:hypothetical protein
VGISEQIQEIGLELVSFAKSGPSSPAHAAEIKERIDAFITANAVSTEDAVLTYRQSCDTFMAMVIAARGLPVASIVSTDGEAGERKPRSVNKAVTERFDELVPPLRNLLEECVGSHAAQANTFFAQQKTAFDQLLGDFLAGIPDGGTKTAMLRSHVNPIKRALKDLLQWDCDLNRLQASTFMSEVKDFLTPATDNPLAMIWHFSPWSCLVPSHNELDEQWYAIRGNWAIQKGLMQVSANGFHDEIKKRSRELGCMCSSQFVFSFTSLPQDMLTPAGLAANANASAARDAFMRKMEQAQIAELPAPAPASEPARAPAPGFFRRLFRRKS